MIRERNAAANEGVSEEERKKQQADQPISEEDRAVCISHHYLSYLRLQWFILWEQLILELLKRLDDVRSLSCCVFFFCLYSIGEQPLSLQNSRAGVGKSFEDAYFSILGSLDPSWSIRIGVHYGQ